MKTPLPTKLPDAEVHFFHSGNGDTILIRGDDEWGLVDANFVDQLRVRERVEALLKNNGVKRLRFVCVTHFDLDHIRGLGNFLRENFQDEDGTWRIDQILLPLSPCYLQTLKILHKLYQQNEIPLSSILPSASSDLSQHAVSLLKVMFGMISANPQHPQVSGCPEFLGMDPGLELFGRKGTPAERVKGMGPWRCLALGPTQHTRERYSLRLVKSTEDISEPLRRYLTRINSNSVSRILVLEHAITGASILLTGDATKWQIREALVAWQRDGEKVQNLFHAIKASHHGARSCHVSDLYKTHGARRKTHAIVCAHDDGKHPGKLVVDEVHCHCSGHRVTGNATQNRRQSGPMGNSRSMNATELDVVLRCNAAGFELSGGIYSRHDATRPSGPASDCIVRV